MKINGYSLVEVLVTIVIMGILMTVAVPAYNGMQTKAKIEAETKELHAAIVSTRLDAMQKKQRRALFLGPNQYVFKVYTSLNDTISAWKTVSTTSLQFPIQKLVSGSLTAFDVSTDKIDFDTNGFTINLMTLVVTPVKYSGGKNCIKVHTARTNMGRMESGNVCTIQ